MVRVGRRQADDDTDPTEPNPDGIPAGELHTAHPHRNREWCVGQNAAPQPGREVTAGRE